jgi:hypothetical protein
MLPGRRRRLSLPVGRDRSTRLAQIGAPNVRTDSDQPRDENRSQLANTPVAASTRGSIRTSHQLAGYCKLTARVDASSEASCLVVAGHRTRPSSRSRPRVGRRAAAAPAACRTAFGRQDQRRLSPRFQVKDESIVRVHVRERADVSRRSDGWWSVRGCAGWPRWTLTLDGARDSRLATGETSAAIVDRTDGSVVTSPTPAERESSLSRKHLGEGNRLTRHGRAG